ncbi:MAG: glycosyltransferase [Pseudoalteromonas sp.]|uniref:glycosyltransferase n=1 Tax=Pseudoalteromonas sp. TaxID=53249 RepID=UPI0025D650F7|nr:glycosyltransferase [Pseudoalteromonas sp.]MCH2088923.1 glycosyltransferase [Pseudoalteromonas sp.]
MYIAYVIDCDFSIDKPSSVTKKVLLQANTWVGLGHQVMIYSISSSLKYNANEKCINTLGRSFSKTTNPLSKLFKLWRTSWFIYEDIKKVRPDVVYSRYLLYTPFITSIYKGFSSIVEVNSNDDIEYERASVFTRYYNRLFKRLLLGDVNGLVCVTDELAGYISKYSNVKNIVIANGYDFSAVKSEALEECKESVVTNWSKMNKPSLIFIASPGNACHGLDILLKVAKVLVDYNFKIVGYNGVNTENIKYYGYLNKDELYEQLANSDIGISALAIERHGMLEACPLKSREYLAYGLPVIGNHFDPDIYGKDIYLKVNNDDVEKMAIQIDLFVKGWMNTKNKKTVVRKLAEPLVSHEAKERNRLNFFSSICGATV